MKGACLLLWAFGLVLPSMQAVADAVPRPVLAVARVKEVPRLRAEADDPAWSGPETGVELRLVKPAAMPEERAKAFATRVEIRWDTRFLYFRFWCFAPEAPWSPHGATRDALHSEGDVVEVFIDAAGDARQFMEVQVSPANGVFDKLYLLAGEPRGDAQGVLLDDVIRRDQWEFSEWNWDGLRSTTGEWRRGGAVIGWIADVALPAKPLLRRLNQEGYEPALTLHAHLVRNACPLNKKGSPERGFLSFSWASIPLGRPHRAPLAMGELQLMP